MFFYYLGLLFNFIFNIIKSYILEFNYIEKGGRKNRNVGIYFIFVFFVFSLLVGEFNLRPFKFFIIILVFNIIMFV